MVELSPGAVEIRESVQGKDQAVRVIECLGEAHPALRVGDPLIELAPLGEGPRPEGAGHHRREPCEPAALALEVAME